MRYFIAFLFAATLLIAACSPKKETVTDGVSKTEMTDDCRGPKLKKQPCTREYRPVCGCDGETYANDCVAKVAGVKTWTEGPCVKAPTGCIDSSLVNPKAICTMDYRPVCGCDGKTYSNRCVATNSGIVHITDGECHPCQTPAKITTKICPETVLHVCGCNGITYNNDCLAEAAGISDYTPGKCSTIGLDCVNPEKGNLKRDCPEIYRPVCGCNGETYSNECEAQRVGVLQWTPGKCQ